MAISVLASCNSNEPAEQALSTTAAPEALSYEEFNTRLTIRDVMNTLIDPNADIVWEAVGYEAMFVDGETVIVDSSPQSDEDWEMLRRNVIAMVEGANSLMIPGREVAPPDRPRISPSLNMFRKKSRHDSEKTDSPGSVSRRLSKEPPCRCWTPLMRGIWTLMLKRAARLTQPVQLVTSNTGAAPSFSSY